MTSLSAAVAMAVVLPLLRVSQLIVKMLETPILCYNNVYILAVKFSWELMDEKTKEEDDLGMKYGQFFQPSTL